MTDPHLGPTSTSETVPRAAPGAWHYLRAFLPQGLALPKGLWRTRHRFLLWVAAAHAFALPFIGMSRGWDPILAVGEGAAIGLLALAARQRSFGRAAQEFLAALALLGSSTALVQFSGGMAAAHAHYFITVALVALYQDWRPFTVALVYVALVNGALGILAPHVAYGPATAHPAKWALIETVLVLGEAVVLLAFWNGAEHLRARGDLVLDSAGEGVIGLDSSGTVTFANPAARALFERPGEDLAGLSIHDLMTGTRFGLVPTNAAPAMATLATRSGRQLPVEWTLTPTLRAGVGIGWVMVLRDVTARRDLEDRLQVRNDQQAIVASLGHEALSGAGLDLFLDRVAHGVAKGLEVDLCQVLEVVPGSDWLHVRAGVGLAPGVLGALVQPTDPVAAALRQPTPIVESPTDADAQATAALAMAVQGRDGAFGVLVAYAARGRRFTRDDVHFLRSVANLVAAAVVRQRDEEELRQHRTNLEALVERRTAELTEANRELEAFSYTVSHDLRSPLRTIGGFSRILRRRHANDLPEDSTRMLTMIDEGAIRMGGLIESVLLLTRIGRTRLASEPIDLSTLARDILDDLAAKTPQRAVEVAVERGLRARGDASLVRLALENLLGNAWKFTSKTPHARITFRSGADGAFVVEDNGAGFDMALSTELFQPFHRLHEPTEFEGTGIGLATVDRIVQRHGGRIWAQAVPGQGATFSFTLAPPASSEARVQDAQPAPPTVRLLARPPPLHTRRV